MLVFLVIVAALAACTAGYFAWESHQRQLAAEAARRQAQIEAEAEAARIEAEKAAEAARLQAEEEAKRKAAEEEARRKAEEEAKKKAEEEAKKKAEEAMLAAHPELKANITITLPSGDRVIDRAQVEAWFGKTPEGTFTKTQEQFQATVRQAVKDWATVTDSRGKKERKWNATGIGEITIITGPYYGWEIDEAAETEQLLAEMKTGEEIKREPVYLSRELFPMTDNYGVGQNYVEIDLSRQYLWLYQNGTVIYETNVVSGLMDETHYTPQGIYPLLNREKDATLKGEKLPNGKYTYETKVRYWMPFTYEGHGLHDADWRSWFGGEDYIWNGSHGCVNLPVEAAETLYNTIIPGTPIVIYYSQGYELRPAPPSEYDQYIAAMEEEERKKQEEEEQKKQEEEQKKAEEEAARKAEEEARKAEEEAARKAEEEAAAQRAAEEEAARQAAEEAARQAAEEATQQAAEEAAQAAEGTDGG